MMLVDDLRRYAHEDASDLPLPAGGATPQRHRALYELARDDLTLARLVEAHTDALAILAEAGRKPSSEDDVYGVWGAEHPSLELAAVAGGGSGSGAIVGTKAFCTGAGLVDRALVTVPTEAGTLLFDIDVRAGGAVTFDSTAWIASAFAETSTATATFAGVEVTDADLVGGPGWYVDRPGFWHGAVGPACCWAGGAAGLVDAAEVWAARRPADPIVDAHIGALAALRWRMEQLLIGAGNEIDAVPDDRRSARRRALLCRHEIDTAAGEIVDRFGRLMGPRPLAFDAAIALRVAEVDLYRRQSHADHDLAQAGRIVLES